MTNAFQEFFSEVEPIVLREPLAETLGAFSAARPDSTGSGGSPAVTPDGAAGAFSYTFADLVKLAGHACPTMAGSWLACQAGLRALYPGETPVRGQIAVTVFGDPDEGTYGVIGHAFTLLTGAAPATGFKGLGPLFKRKDLLKKHGIPEGHKPAIVLILGYPATTFLKAVRRPFLMVQGLDGR